MKAFYFDLSDRILPQPRTLIAESNNTEQLEEQEVEVNTTGDVNDTDGVLHLNEVCYGGSPPITTTRSMQRET